MKNIPLGSTGVSISPITLGGNTFGWTSTREESFEVLDAYLAGGGTTIDTADAYSAWAPGNRGGESEETIGQWLAARGYAKGSGREGVVVATKVAKHPQFEGLSPKNVAAACDASLERLGVDFVDVYFAHFDDDAVAIPDMAEAFSALVDAGKARAVGVSNFTPERMEEWLRCAEENGLHKPTILQQHYNLVKRRRFEASYLPLAREHGMASQSYFALASGFLTGKYRSEDDAKANAARGGAAARYLTEEGIAVLAALDDVAAQLGASPASVALAWQHAKGVDSPVASARTVGQLPDLLAALDLTLTAEQAAILDAASAPMA